MIHQPLFSMTRNALLAISSSLAFLSPVLAPLPSVAQEGITWENSPKETLDQSWQIVYREYVDPSFNHTNWMESRHALLSKDYSSPESAYTELRSTLSQLEDPYTRFLDPEQYQSLTNQTRGELSGIGMRLRHDQALDRIVVEQVMPDSPAMKAGVQNGDVILVIDGQSTQGMDVAKAAELIRGEVGTSVTLRFSRKGEEIEHTLTRQQIEVPSVSYTRRQEGNREVGYIRLSQFTSHAAREMRDAIRTLNPDVEGFVLDLRGNPGGLLNASIDIARMWIDEGTIVKTVDRDNRDQELKANSTAITSLPLVVLVDQNSASSSEILAGALQDNRRGIIVGHQTFGKALVQSLHALEDGSGIAVTIAHYYTPNGTDISKRGLTPDVAVSLNQDQLVSLNQNPEQFGTDGDPQYVEAIELLQTLISAKPAQPQLSERPLSDNPTE
jgi:carboxyl-terminal processing protease